MQSLAKPITEAAFHGIMDNVPPEDVPPGFFTKLDNVFCSDSQITKVFGSTAINTAIATKPFNGLTAFEILSSGDKWLVTSINGASNAQLYYSTGGNCTAIGSANLTNSKPVWFETAANVLFGFNGSEVVTWDGTTVTKNPTAIPIGLSAEYFHNYLFVANTSGEVNRLYWSALGNPTQFAGGIDTYTIDAAGGGYAVGDVITVSPQVNGSGINGTFVVTTINGSGGVTGLTLLTEGSGYAVANGYLTTDSNATDTATGAGCTINITAIDTTTVSNYIDINPGDGDEILGLSVIQDELLVFKRNTIWAITGFSGISFSSTTAAAENTNGRIFGYGCVSGFSIVPVGNDVYYFSMLGATPVIRSLTKTINAVTLDGGVISNNIKTTLSNITIGSLSGIVGSFDGRYCYWSIPTGGSSTNNQIIAMDTWEITTSKGVTTYPFTTMSGKNASYFAASTIPGNTDIYFTDAASSGLVFKFDTSVYTNNGTNITMTVQTRDYFSDFARKTKWKYLYTTYQSGNAAMIGVNAKIDQGATYATIDTISAVGNSPGLGSFILGTSALGGATTSTQRSTFPSYTCHYLNIQYLETSANAVTIHHWELYGKPRGLRAH